MKKIPKLLSKKYYLDKNFYELSEPIIKKLAKSGFYTDLSEETIADIVIDTLKLLTPEFLGKDVLGREIWDSE